MALHLGQTLSHYRILEKIGEGGMGIVYRAEDTTLRRHVALKVLPPEIVSSEERRLRFLREARTAAAVTHPSIATIHEIDETDGVVFIAMELVQGAPLRQLIDGRPMPVKEAVRLAVEMAEGLAEAHKARIIHRDFKPDNVIVMTSGHAKLLDFGLAKLLHEHVPEDAGDLSSLSTLSAEMTVEGKLVGTPAYMSPEQVRGRPVDARSDLFSFGITVYEMVTGHPPFRASSLVDTLAAVIGKDPKPPSQINGSVPEGLDLILARCLEKEREARYQDAGELLLDLRSLQESLASRSAGEMPFFAGKPGTKIRPRRRPGRIAAWIGIVAVLSAATALTLQVFRSRQADPKRAGEILQNMRMSSITGGQDIRRAVLSPDARYLAILREGSPSSSSGSLWSITMRQMATGSEIQVVQPQQDMIFHLTFSTDGERLVYVQSDKTGAHPILMEIPALGGAARKRMANLDSAVAFSPDGDTIAFTRESPNAGESNLLIFDLTTDTERLLATVKLPERILPARPAWSPDGQRILQMVSSPDEGGRSRIFGFDAASGAREPFDASWPDPQADSLAWLGRDAVVVSAKAHAGASMNQLWLVPWPEGGARRITNELGDYRDISASADGTTLVTLRGSRTSNLWSVPIEQDAAPRQLTFGSVGADVIEEISPATGGRIAFTAEDDLGFALWTIEADGSSRRKISTERHTISSNPFAMSGRDEVVITARGQDSVPHVWKMDLDGGNAVQLTDGSGETLNSLSPDGEVMNYLTTGAPDEIWRVSTVGGAAEKVARSTVIKYPVAGNVNYSPDGTLIMFMDVVESTSKLFHVVMPAAGGAPIATFWRDDDSRIVRWHPDGKALTYVRFKKPEPGSWTLMRWPIDGAGATPMFSFRGDIDSYEWAPDGRVMVFRARDSRGTNLWTWPLDGSLPPRPLTDFSSGEILRFRWTQDSRSVVFTQGFSSQDVVAFRGLR